MEGGFPDAYFRNQHGWHPRHVLFLFEQGRGFVDALVHCAVFTLFEFISARLRLGLPCRTLCSMCSNIIPPITFPYVSPP